MATSDLPSYNDRIVLEHWVIVGVYMPRSSSIDQRNKQPTSGTPVWALEKIREAKKSKSSDLDLSLIIDDPREKLTDLPEEIFELSWLTALSLDLNQLSTLPDSIIKLQNLRDLFLGGNQLGTLPESITQLQNLTRLSLAFNDLSSLPESITQLQNLRDLYLGGNQLSTLPESITQLQNITKLDLRHNQLSALPASISLLQNLTALDLRGNQIHTLPESIIQLQNLTTLDLSGNQLHTLPESIRQLQNLTTLDLSNNELVVLPGSLGGLRQLQRLELSNNQLTSLPDSLGNLTLLGTIDLSDNQLTHIPASFTRLRNLKTLRLNNNPLNLDPAAAYRQEKVSYLEVTLDQDVDSLTEEFLDKFCITLANAFDVDVKNIVLLGFRPGSIELLIAILSAISALPDAINLALRAFKPKNVKLSDKLQEAFTFISYAHKDISTVDAVYYYLVNQNMHPWLDKFELRGGHRWEEVLFEKIESSTGFIFCLSKNSKDRLKNRTILYRELMAAKEKSLMLKSDESFLIPLNLDGCKIPKVIREFQVLAWDKDKESLVQSLRDGFEQSKRRHAHV
jgi:Leucine-rich repeat (LRR) protein